MGDTEKFGAHLLNDEPVPFWLIRLPGVEGGVGPPFESMDFLHKLDQNLLLCQFRGVSADRLNFVLSNGIDVDPTDSVIYALDLVKAWEYGGWPKLLLALDTSRLQRTFKEVPSDISADELERLRQHYPTVIRDGAKLWLSRFPEGNCRIATTYETYYAWWIKGDPFQTLRAIMLFARPEDEADVGTLLKSAAISVQL